MFVPASPRHVRSVDVLVEGQLYSISSGLGGSHTVKYTGKTGSLYEFYRKPHGDWPKMKFKYTAEEVLASIYISAPTEDWAQVEWDKERSKTLTYSKTDEGHEAWFPPAEETKEYRRLVLEGVLTHPRVCLTLGSDVRECVLDNATGMYYHVLDPGWTIGLKDPRIDKITFVK